jgi:lysophospholipase L1-like esterase
MIVISLVVVLAMLEVGLRAANGYLGDWSNLVLDARTVLAKTEGQRFKPDDRLGYVPTGGTRGNGITGAVTGGGADDSTDNPIVLAVGDSYTYGEEVEDGDSWPALLQSLLARPVVNGGVSGYGFDQIVLRAEALAAQLKPGRVVVGFIADDIRRTEMRRLWGAEKPYFDLAASESEGGKLELRNVPVPPRPDPASTLSVWQRLFGRSYLFDFALRRLGLLHEWFGDHVRVHPEGSGERIACALAARLADLQKSSGARVLLVALYDPVVWQDASFAAEQRRLTDGLLACAARQGLVTLDTFAALAADGRKAALYGRWHFNAAGNRLVAELIARALAQPDSKAVPRGR